MTKMIEGDAQMKNCEEEPIAQLENLLMQLKLLRILQTLLFERQRGA